AGTGPAEALCAVARRFAGYTRGMDEHPPPTEGPHVSRLRPAQTVILLVCLPLALRGGPAAGQEGPVPFPRAGVVFVADGSGNLHATVDGLSQVVGDAGVPLDVVAVGWSHGTGRVFADLHGRSNHR